VTTTDELLEQYGAYGLEKQQALAEFLGHHNWSVDLAAGTVDFEERRVFPIQVIGTESSAEGTWLWAWANTASNIPFPLLSSARMLRAYGERHGVREFVEPELRAQAIDAHVVGLVAAGVADADAYYLGHYPGGAVLFLVSAPQLRALLTPSVLRMTTVFTTFISTWTVRNQLRAFAAYAEAKGCHTERRDSVVECVDRAGQRLSGEFDARGLLVRLSSSVGSGRT
jgi:hypothetical protein